MTTTESRNIYNVISGKNNRYRDKLLGINEEKIKAVQEAANHNLSQPIRHMAIVDPDQRASAADMLKGIFGGEGLTTPYN